MIDNLDEILHITNEKLYFKTGIVMCYSLLQPQVTPGERVDRQLPLVLCEVTEVLNVGGVSAKKKGGQGKNWIICLRLSAMGYNLTV